MMNITNIYIYRDDIRTIGDRMGMMCDVYLRVEYCHHVEPLFMCTYAKHWWQYRACVNNSTGGSIEPVLIIALVAV